MAQRARGALVFEFGHDDGRITTSRFARATFSLTTQGKAAHAAQREHGINAITALMTTISLLQALDNGRDIRFNVGTVEGGTGINVVPEIASARFEFRSPSESTMDQIEQYLKQLENVDSSSATVSIKRLSRGPVLFETAASVALFESYADASAKVGLRPERYQHERTGSDANRFSAAGVPCIDGLGPNGAGAHSDAEYVLLPSIQYKLASLVSWLEQLSAR